MRRWIALLMVVVAASAWGQTGLSTKWEELTGPDFVTAIQQAQGACVLPFGIIEKHGPHLPLGTDLINVRYAVEHATQQEYAVIFPAYYFGQIAEARQQPGTVSYSMHMQLDLLQETTDEMARNGCKKIVIVNGHGGNEHLLPFFAQSQLQTPHDYVVYVYRWSPAESAGASAAALEDRHARRRIGDRPHHGVPAGPGASGSREARSRAPMKRGSICRMASTRGSGGMRGSRITTRATEAWLRKNWASST